MTPAEPYATPHLLAPGTLIRPGSISAADWEHMPWRAKWNATRRLVTDVPDWLATARANRHALNLLIVQRGTRHIIHTPGSHSEGIAS